MNDCPLCGVAADSRLLAKQAELRSVVTTLIRHDHPDWHPEQGVCPPCASIYAERFATLCSATPLNNATDPHTTFPYYHHREETVLSQPARLPDYATFDGRGVTIAFLDSGFYPHPDLLAANRWPGEEPEWARLNAQQMRNALATQALRLATYVDLTDGEERVGLEQESLWNTAGYSWHGQMTSVVAAGNGLMSGGHFRGYAPGANVLPIKIGRSNGGIPEADILAGLCWLLRDDNWKRYGVGVVNISVGGDYPQHWEESELSLAAEQLSRKGVLIAAASGNSGQPLLLPPAQTPSVVTVGGYDDANRRWNPYSLDRTNPLTIYHHNYGEIAGLDGREQKPEILGLARYLPAPVLPGTPVLREVHAIGKLRRTLAGDSNDRNAHLYDLLDHWHRVMHVDEYNQPARDEIGRLVDAHADAVVEQSLHEIWHSLRKRMNAHKWVHDYYQHVDGTSVAVAQVAAVAAQMFQANPRLDAAQVRTILLSTALDMPHWPAEQRGAGILQPARAVAAALRAPGGLLQEVPFSGTSVHASRLRKWVFQGKVPNSAIRRLSPTRSEQFVYFGLHAPRSQQVSLIGGFNGWEPGLIPLACTAAGWWQVAITLPAGRHEYRFWVTDSRHPDGDWRTDPENPLRTESGYRQPHSFVIVD